MEGGLLHLFDPGCDTCFAPSTREAGWDAKHILNHDFGTVLKQYVVPNALTVRVIVC